MAGTLSWVAIAGAAVVWETVCRTGRRRSPDISRTGAMLARRLPWRIVLAATWIFVGVHLFARYSVPGH